VVIKFQANSWREWCIPGKQQQNADFACFVANVFPGEREQKTYFCGLINIWHLSERPVKALPISSKILIEK
jgi:hypothetical protein